MKGVHLMVIISLIACFFAYHVRQHADVALIVILAPWVLWLFGLINPTTGFEGDK